MLYREAKHRKRQGKKGKFESQWTEGVMLGIRGRSSEYVVWGEGRIHETRDVKRQAPSGRWNKALIDGVTKTCAKHHGSKGGHKETREMPRTTPTEPKEGPMLRNANLNR